MQNYKKLFGSVSSKRGSYSMAMTVVVIAIVITANLIIGKLPEAMRIIDISDQKIYEVSDTSRTILDKLDKKVTFHVLADKKTIDKRITAFLTKYSKLSKNLSLDFIDPVLHPTALTQYNTEADTIVVSCEETDKTMTIPFSSIIVMDQNAYYTTGQVTESQFDGEGQLTSAVNYVTNDVQKIIYQTTGHGELTLSMSAADMLNKSNLKTSELNLIMSGSIPEDCDLLMMYAPSNDITEDEKTQITEYMKSGGDFMLLLGDGSKDTPNLKALMAEYGMQQEDGYVADMQRSYQGNYYYLVPNVSVSGDMAKGITSDMVLMINSLGLTEIDPARDSITRTSFLTTSEDSYVIKDNQDKEKKQGTYTLGAVATEGDSRFTVIAGNTLIDAQVTDTFSTLENLQLFTNAVTSNFEGLENISVEPKSLTIAYNSISNPGLFSMLIIIVIPAAILIAGLSVWLKRRKA